ncbi:hypothetical protein V6N13_025856 [Hibiscus sabdariffa]
MTDQFTIHRSAASRLRALKGSDFLPTAIDVAVKELIAVAIPGQAQKFLSSPLTMASYGNVVNDPSYDSVSSKFK